MNRDIIYKELVQLDLEAESTDEVFSILAEKLEKAGYIRSGFLEAIKEREKNYPTALPIEPYPVAIPHTDPKCIVKPFVACVRLKHPIPWREMAANEIIHQVKFAFMLGFQEADAGESHIELLQILVNNLQKVELMEKLHHANTVEEYWKLIISMDGLEDS